MEGDVILSRTYYTYANLLDISTISDSACNLLFSKGVPMEHQQWITETFMSSSQLQSLEFSSLHEAILGLRANVQEELLRLRSKDSKIDKQDLWGYTPLHCMGTLFILFLSF